jgi:hypothetical protein
MIRAQVSTPYVCSMNEYAVLTSFNYQLNTQFLYFIIIYYIVILDMFRAILCSSSGGQILLLQHLV